MSRTLRPERWTIDGFLTFEATSEVRHEFVDGEVFAMAGGSERHAVLAAEALMLLGVSLRGRPCFPVGSDLLVRVDDDAAFYPDVQVRCPDRGAVVVVEVLSESTEAWDRGGKFERYRRLKALEHYVLIAQDHEFVEHYRRNGDGTWTYTPLRPGDVLRMDGIADLLVDEVYGRARTLPAS